MRGPPVLVEVSFLREEASEGKGPQGPWNSQLKVVAQKYSFWLEALNLPVKKVKCLNKWKTDVFWWEYINSTEDIKAGFPIEHLSYHLASSIKSSE